MEGVISLTPDQQKEFNLRIQVVDQGTTVGTGLRPGRVEEDPDRKAVVSSQVPGTLMTVYAKVGDPVQMGAPLAVVVSPQVTALQTEYHEAEVEADLAAKELANKRELLSVNDEIQRPVENAKLELSRAQANREAAQARLRSSVLKHERLEALLEDGIASRQQVEESEAERKVLEAQLEEATSAVQIAESHLARERRVTDQNLRTKAETFPAEARLARAREQMRHARERLEQLGAKPSGHSGAVELRSPIGGVLVERMKSRGETVSPGESIATVVELSTVWVWVDLQRFDLGQVQKGDSVEVSLENQPSVRSEGRIDYISPLLEANSQAVRTRIILKDPPELFKLGSFVNARVNSDLGVPQTLIPQRAVQMVEGETVVYEETESGFVRRPVLLGSEVGDDEVTVQEGIEIGDKIVVDGAQELKAVDLSSTIGEHHH